MPFTKKQETNNFAAPGRVLSSGAVKASRFSKKADIDAANEDYKPETNENGVKSDSIPRKRTKRKRAESEDDELGVDGASVKQRGEMTKKASKALQSMLGEEALEQLRIRTFGVEPGGKKEDFGSDLHAGEQLDSQAKESKVVKGAATEDAKGIVGIEGGTLRGGRSRDVFVNKHGQGRTLG